MSTAAVSVAGLTKIYANGHRANDDVSIEVGPGEIVGLVGPNGAGKTTLVRQVLGLLRPTAVRIEGLGETVEGRPGLVRQAIGYVPQMPLSFPALSVEETARYVLGMGMRDRAVVRRRVDEALILAGLADSAHTAGYQLSPGMMKLLMLGVAVAQSRPVLVLDEPTAMVDVANRARIWASLRRESSVSVLLASHDMNEIRSLCDRAYVMIAGHVVTQGTPASIARSFRLPVEAKFVIENAAVADRTLSAAGVTFSRYGSTMHVEFADLRLCLRFLADLADAAGLSYVSLEGPSFETAVVELMKGGIDNAANHDSNRSGD